jgi:hypothetical protein
LLERICPSSLSVGDYSAGAIIVVFGIGSFVFSLRVASTFFRPTDPWARRPVMDRLLISTVGIAAGAAGTVVSGYMLLFCR